MSYELYLLTLTAASVGFIHTILGPDHYIPFVAMAKAGNWSTLKTAVVTFFAGLAHVASSVVLGIFGIGFGIALNQINAIESFRGNIAGWALIAFGLIYTIWGIRKAMKNKTHTHWHSHEDGNIHQHKHNHHNNHLHLHRNEKSSSITPWVLFSIFIFGPCEALIPLLMYPAISVSITGLIFVIAIFAVTTISTMLLIVFVSLYGIKFLPTSKLEKYAHALAGAVVLISGVSVQLLGL